MSASTTDLSIQFGAAGNAGVHTIEGWSTPEANETWSLGARSVLVFATPVQPATYVLRLVLRPHVVAGRLAAQRLRVLVNGQAVADFTIARRTVRACRIPWPAIAGQPRLTIAFETPDAARPADLGSPGDDRPLGVALAQLQLYADQNEARQPGAALMDDGPVPVDIATILQADRIGLRELMFGFESLGQNCEFGLVQRRCEAEPLGLLRFSSTPLAKLLVALEARFEGMGSPDSIHVEPSANGREYMIRDSRFDFLYHAFVATGAMEVEDLHRREMRRVPFLIRKLLEDLESGEKTFVFKGMGAMEEEEVFPLAMALRRYGPNTLLFVNLADADHAAGSVEVRAPGFLVGYLNRFAPGEDAAELDLSQWVRLCRQAYRYRLAAALPPGP